MTGFRQGSPKGLPLQGPYRLGPYLQPAAENGDITSGSSCYAPTLDMNLYVTVGAPPTSTTLCLQIDH